MNGVHPLNEFAEKVGTSGIRRTSSALEWRRTTSCRNDMEWPIGPIWKAQQVMQCTSVDGRNPAPVEIGSLLSHYFQGLYIPGGCLGFLNHQQFGDAECVGYSLVLYNLLFRRFGNGHGGSKVHPGRLTWNLIVTPLEKEIPFQTITFRFYINLQGCILQRPSFWLTGRWPRCNQD